MRILGVSTRETFEEWLEEEKRLLKTLSKEPPEETMNMEYYQRLVNLAEAEAVLAKLLEDGMPMEFETGGGDYGTATTSGLLPIGWRASCRTPAACRHQLAPSTNAKAGWITYA
ncbi:hypothetical protein MKEN_01008300 [Mycena kentingensis (nom. inval.)]|nr:hypothetical protein MKEN_01008300 [Mycena kentingensis (nom. inval.)]